MAILGHLLWLDANSDLNLLLVNILGVLLPLTLVSSLGKLLLPEVFELSAGCLLFLGLSGHLCLITIQLRQLFLDLQLLGKVSHGFLFL